MGKSHDGFKLSLNVVTKELLNENSFQGGGSLINAALNLVSLSIAIFFQAMLCLMIMCSTRASG